MNKITIITTDEKKKQYWEKTEVSKQKVEDCMHVINVYPEVTYQMFHGFGGAFTEAAAHIYSKMRACALNTFSSNKILVK